MNSTAEQEGISGPMDNRTEPGAQLRTTVNLADNSHKPLNLAYENPSNSCNSPKPILQQPQTYPKALSGCSLRILRPFLLLKHKALVSTPQLATSP